MKNNVIKVFLYGREICKLQWNGGYKPGFGKLGSVVSFNPDYHTFGFDIDPMGPYSLSTYFVRKGMSDICRRGEYEGLPRFLSGFRFCLHKGYLFAFIRTICNFAGCIEFT